MRRSLLLCSFLVTGSALAQSTDKPLALADTPSPVQKIINAQLNGGTVDSILLNHEPDGDTSYDVSLTKKDGKELDFTVTDTGRVESIVVALNETPAAVQKTIQAQTGDDTLERIDKTFEDDAITYTYDVTLTLKNGQERDLSVAPDGRLERMQVPLESLPAAVQKTIRAQVVSPSKLGDIEKILDPDGTTYAFDVIATSGGTRSFSVAENGHLDSMEVFMAEIPVAAQHSVQTVMGQGKLDTINKSYDGSNFTFEVDVIDASGKGRHLSLAANGTINSLEAFLPETPDAVQKTIKSQLGQNKLDSIQKSAAGDSTIYQVTMRAADGTTRDFTIAPDGKLESLEVILRDTPAAVQKTIHDTAGTNKLGDIMKNFEPDGIVYEVEMTGRDGRARSFVVTEAGKLDSKQVFLDEIPAVVQAAITSRLAQGTLDTIEENYDEDGITYDVDIATKNGGSRSITLNATGGLE